MIAAIAKKKGSVIIAIIWKPDFKHGGASLQAILLPPESREVLRTNFS